MSDKRIVELAIRAGLCLPQCWHLEHLVEGVGQPDPEGMLKMRQLRTFAQLIATEVITELVATMEDPLGLGEVA